MKTVAQGLSISEALELWRRANVDIAPKTVMSYRFSLRKLERSGIKLVRDATPRAIFLYLQAREVTASTRNTELSALLSVLSTLERADLFPFEDLRRLRRLKIRRSRKKRFAAVFLARDDVECLCRAAARTSRPGVELLIRLGVLSGLRGGEMARLRWEDVNLGEGPTINVRDGKTGGRVVPVCHELKALLLPIAKPEGWLFPQAVGARGRPPSTPYKLVRTLNRELVMARKFAGLKGVDLHCLRHTRASWWAQANVSLARIAQWLGNSTAVVERFYASFIPSYDPLCEARVLGDTSDPSPDAAKRLGKVALSPVALRTATEDRRRARVLSGKWQSGSAPYGFRLDEAQALVVDPGEAVVVRLIFAEYLRVGSVSGVVRELEQRGIRTRSGAKFWMTPVRWILQNAVYTGRVRVGGELLVGVHERLVDEQAFEAAQRLMADTTRTVAPVEA